MKKRYCVPNIFIGVLLVAGAFITAAAQDVSAVEVQIETLRARLRDVVDREARLRERVAKLDEDLRPESIERSVAAVGTTDAEALRARRREQIEREKSEFAAQLSEVSAKRAGLEAEIAAAEAEAVRLKAAALAPKEAAPRDAPAAAPAAPSPAPAAKRRAPPKKIIPRKRNRPRRRT
ncbi:MAG TPA: hypothetical protein VF586_20010 [Pyrinomonadaceae bacterium]